jgi:hypothetical protein
MGRQIIHHQNLSGFENGRQCLADKRDEQLGIGRPVEAAEATMPSALITAIVLIRFQCPCGTFVTTRSLGAARPCLRCRVVVAPNSSSSKS